MVETLDIKVEFYKINQNIFAKLRCLNNSKKLADERDSLIINWFKTHSK